MRRIAVFGTLGAVGIVFVCVLVRDRMPKLHERLMARCEAIFERMPDSFPPKKMMGGIEEIRVTTARIEALLERQVDNGSAVAGASSEEAHDAA